MSDPKQQDGEDVEPEERAELTLTHRSNTGVDLDLQAFSRQITMQSQDLSWWQKWYIWFKTIDYDHPHKVYVSQLLDGGLVTLWMTLLTMWALYAEDFKQATTDVDADDAFSWIAFVALIFFLLEWILASWSKKDYIFSFFFWLDLIGTLSLITDVIFIADALGMSTSGDGADPSSARAGRAARAGTRAGRVVRIIRLVRIGKLSKQFFSWWYGKNAQDDVVEQDTSSEQSEMYNDDGKPSNLGSHLSQLITKRVIIGVLTIIFVVPFLQPSEAENLYDAEFVIQQLNDMYSFSLSGDISNAQFEQYLTWFKEDYINGDSMDKELVYLEINGETEINQQSVIDGLRVTETEAYEVGYIKAMFSVETIKIEDAWKSIGLTTYLIFMLTILAMVFNNDTQKYVISPIQKMVASVKTLTENPKDAANGENAQTGEFETAMLQGTIQRIGKLLQLGFGEAGSEIIRQSLSSNLTANIGGRNMNAIFGFCDIRNFTDATECLQQEIMNFVNEIADVVHGIVVKYGGAPNKNVGDAFLLVWSLPDECVLSETSNNQAFQHDNQQHVVSQVQTLADCALISLIKIIIAINEKNKTQFMKYRKNKAILKRMGEDWEVKLGWGLHCGYGIEGAIGSRFKIDASYLSPNVNLAEDLEGATKFYGVPFLVSEHMVNILSPFVKSVCRQVDRVHIAGIEKPFNLYCVDIWQTHQDKLEKLGFQTTGELVGEFEAQDVLDMNKSERKFFTDEELNSLHEGFPVQHKQVWQEGLDAYLQGDWMNAKGKMEQVLQMLPTDGPCSALLNYMKLHEFKCPEDWQGFREHE